MKDIWNSCMVNIILRSFEDHLSDKIGSLQNPFFFIPYRHKQKVQKQDQREKDVYENNKSFVQN